VTKNDIVTTVKSYIGRPVSVLREKNLTSAKPSVSTCQKKKRIKRASSNEQKRKIMLHNYILYFTNIIIKKWSCYMTYFLFFTQ